MSLFQDIFEAQSGSIKPGQNVVIVDDLLATGGEIIHVFVNNNKSIKQCSCVNTDSIMYLPVPTLNCNQRSNSMHFLSLFKDGTEV